MKKQSKKEKLVELRKNDFYMIIALMQDLSKQFSSNGFHSSATACSEAAIGISVVGRAAFEDFSPEDYKPTTRIKKHADR